MILLRGTLQSGASVSPCQSAYAQTGGSMTQLVWFQEEKERKVLFAVFFVFVFFPKVILNLF